MSVENFFAQQLEQIGAFLSAWTPPVRVIAIDGEMRPILARMLLGLDSDEEFPHLLLGHPDAFADPMSWFEALQNELETQLAENAEEIRSVGMEVPASDPGASLAPPWRFLRRAESVTKALPEEIGALAFILDPEQVADEAGYRRSVEFLAVNVKSSRLKFIVLDDRAAPRLAELAAEHERIETQVFWLDPRAMQQSIDAELSEPGAAPSSAKLAQAAAFAAADQDHERAIKLNWQRLMQVEKEGGAPTDRVLARLDYGRALAEAGHPEPAIETLSQACDLCCAQRLDSLAPLAYTDLGIALNRAGNAAQSFEALRIGSEFFRAQDNVPGEAHVCDTLAKIHEERGEAAEAERVWRYALGLYEGITNPQLAELRAAGVADIEGKLARLRGGGDG